jgi:hypothetical protein
MTRFPAPYDAICDDVRRRGRPDGALLGVFLNRERRIVLTTEVSEGTHHVDELFLRHLVSLVTDIGVAEVAFAVARSTGRPTRIDKLLWREMVSRLGNGPTSLLDLIVVGEDRWWSAANALVGASHEARRASARTAACPAPPPQRRRPPNGS